jgi:nitrogen fixation/metabolism regulation signal transduction histidine kinase
VGLSAAALAILMGALVGAVLARPIRKLWEVVRGIRDGKTDLRASIRGEDEVSFLAECFNKLMDDVHGPPPTPPQDRTEEKVES